MKCEYIDCIGGQLSTIKLPLWPFSDYAVHSCVNERKMVAESVLALNL